MLCNLSAKRPSISKTKCKDFLHKKSGCYPCRHDEQTIWYFPEYHMIWADVCAVSGAHLMYQAGFLTYRSSLASPSHTFGLCNGFRSSLPEYSDQFAQDSHLIPSSDCYADNNLHFISSIWNYTDIIITRCQFAVNNPHNICQIFIILCILENALFCYCFSADYSASQKFLMLRFLWSL